MMFKTKPRLPRASGLFGKFAQLKGHGEPAKKDSVPDMEAFEANYAQEMMHRSGIFAAKKRVNKDTAF